MFPTERESASQVENVLKSALYDEETRMQEVKKLEEDVRSKDEELQKVKVDLEKSNETKAK